jgi:hypothetical protein
LEIDYSNFLSVSDYARKRGVAKYAVQNAIKSGMLKDSVVRGVRNKIWLDPIKADLEYVPRVSNKNSAREKKEDGELNSNEPMVKDSSTEIDPETGQPIALIESDGSRIPLVAKSRARIEFYKAEQERLEFEKKLGSLVDHEEVRQSAIKIARSVRDSMMNIPDRLSAELAAETDTFKIHQRLSSEIRKCLESLKDDYK